MGGLIEIFGHRLNTMNALLAVLFVFVAVSVDYVAWNNFVRDNPGRDRHSVLGHPKRSGCLTTWPVRSRRETGPQGTGGPQG